MSVSFHSSSAWITHAIPIDVDNRSNQNLIPINHKKLVCFAQQQIHSTLVNKASLTRNDIARGMHLQSECEVD